MPARQPFTVLCQAIARDRHPGWVDLHLHTTFSDGTYTPAQVVDLAGRSGLAAVAITDHDTIDGIAPARAVAKQGLEVIAGVEITAEDAGGEVHLLGYFVCPEDAALTAALARLRTHRTGRFWEMVERLRHGGVALEEADLQALAVSGVLGRRHLAELLVKARRAGSVREAFARYLHDGGRAVVPKLRLPVAEAIALVRGAGGVASWAHPAYHGAQERLRRLRGLGLQAVEVEFPGCQPSRGRQLRSWAAAFGLAVTGGSDCHGPGHYRCTVGARGVTSDELEGLRRLASS
jgi:predicted metal-dependent phosphoesterase TrpH